MITLALFLLIIAIFAPTFTFAILYNWKRITKKFENIDGPKEVPIVGNALQLDRDPNKFYHQIMGYAETYSSQGMFLMWVGTSARVVLTSPRFIGKLLSSNTELTKSRDYDFLHPWFGAGLLTSTDAKWKKHRKLLTPTFHFKILEDFTTVFVEQSNILVKKLESKADTDEIIDMYPLITLGALDIICETAMGRKVNAQHDSESTYVKAISRSAELIQERQKSPWLWPDFLYGLTGHGRDFKKQLNILHTFTNQVIKERKAQFNHQESENKEDEYGAKKRVAFLDMMLMNENEFSDQILREEVDTFMFEGHDTTAAAMAWAIYFLGKHPDIQRKVCEELDVVLGDEERDMTSDDIRDLHYLDCVIKEALRLYPSVPITGRKLVNDLDLDGVTIPSGTDVYVLAPFVHRDPKNFTDPLTFNPDRFLSENIQHRHPYAYVPFSAGPRNCIGQKFALMEEKVVISSIVRKYRIEAVQTEEELHPTAELILRPISVKVKLTKRVGHY